MKTILLLFSLSLVVNISAQEYDQVYKIKKNVNVVYKNDLVGLTVNNKLVVPIEHTDYFQYSMGIVFYSDSTAGMVDFTGKVIIPFENSEIFEEYPAGFIVARNHKGENAVYDSYGKIIVPYGMYDPLMLEEVIIVVNGDFSSMYDYEGNVIIPHGEQIISNIDDWGEQVSLQKKGEKAFMWLTENYDFPKGYSMVNERFYAKQTEVSIEEYFLFVSDQKSNEYLADPETGEVIPYSKLLPDTNFVEAKLLPLYRHLYRQLAIIEGGKEHSKGSFIFRKSSYTVDLPYKLKGDEIKMTKFPVTGVNIKQAKLYADWLTLISAEWSDLNYEYNANYRIPTETEWITMAEDGLSESMKSRHVLDSVNMATCMLFIYSGSQTCKGYEAYLKASLGSGSVPVTSMNPDLNGIMNLFGNVSEMTSTNGVSKGGNYQLPASEANTQKQQNYAGPQPWLGFRVIGEYGFFY